MRKEFIFIVLGLFIASLGFISAEQNDSNSLNNSNQNQTNNNQTCSENWSCGDWSNCINNSKTRTCNDVNNCNTTLNKLPMSKECKIEKEDKDDNKNKTEIEDCWKCSKLSNCINNTQTRICTKITNCTDNEDDNETPKTSKKCDIKEKIKERLRIGECPEKCTCSGSTIKCKLEDGTRIMTVYAGKSGNIIVQIKGINMTTNVTLYKDENGTLTGEFRGNQTRIIKFLPDQIRERIKEKIKSKLENENIELDEDGNYKIKAEKKSRLFFIIPVKEKFESSVNSETGEIVIIKGSWWGFLARDVKEE